MLRIFHYKYRSKDQVEQVIYIPFFWSLISNLEIRQSLVATLPLSPFVPAAGGLLHAHRAPFPRPGRRFPGLPTDPAEGLERGRFFDRAERALGQ
jgi:hypothetical protein